MKEVRISDFSLNNLLDFCKDDSIKALATANLARLGLPNKKTEHYRYFSIDKIFSKN